LSKTKIEQKYSAKYVPTVLWWEDVTEIFETLQANAKAVELETAKYKFTTLDIAKEHFGTSPQYDVKFSSSSPYVNLEPGSLYVGGGPSAAQIFMEIDSVLKRRQRRPRWIYGSWLIIPSIGLGLVTYGIAGDTAKYTVLTVQVIFTLLYMYSVYVGLRRAMVVHPQKRSEVPGFFGRNKDQVLMYVVTTVLGGLLTFAGIQLKEHFLSTAPTIQK
jgi:hypothetical protein